MHQNENEKIFFYHCESSSIGLCYSGVFFYCFKHCTKQCNIYECLHSYNLHRNSSICMIVLKRIPMTKHLKYKKMQNMGNEKKRKSFFFVLSTANNRHTQLFTFLLFFIWKLLRVILDSDALSSRINNCVE